jgi:hypothetical protein
VVAEKITFRQFAAKISVGKFGATVWAGGEIDLRADEENGRVSRLRSLIYSDRVFLLAPKKRHFDAFGQSFRAKLGRLVTGDDGLDDPGSQEPQRVRRRT